MIKSKEVKSKYAAVCTALSEKKIKDALNQIQQLVIESHHGDLIDAHYNLEFTYKNILKYTVEGISDPERQKVYNHLIKDVYSLADKIYMTLLTQHSSDQCYQLRREFSKSTFEKIHNDYFKTLDKAELKRDANISQQADSQLQQQSETIFNWLWSSSIVSSAEKELIKGIFFNRQVYWYNKALFVSAITLSLLRSFSSEYISLLLDLVKHPDDQISARALTGLLLALYKYDSRLPLYPDLYTRLFMLAEEKGMNTLIQSVTIQLIRTRETEEIAQKLHDEIIPEVAKMQPKITEKLDLSYNFV